MKAFNVKITFEENGQQAAVLVFKAKRKEVGTNVELTIDTDEQYALSAHLAKHLLEYINTRLRNLAHSKTPTAQA